VVGLIEAGKGNQALKPESIFSIYPQMRKMERKMKMFRLASRTCLIISILAVFGLNACKFTVFHGNHSTVRGSGNVIEEPRTISGFSGVSLDTMGQLSIEVGNIESLRIVAEDNLMDFIETEVHAGELKIKSRPNVNLKTTATIRYYLTVIDLNKISIYSSGDIQAPDLKAKNFSITVGSSGSLDMGDLEAETLNVDIFSSGNVKIGVLKANTLDVNISSSGDLDIKGGEVKTQDIALNSSGKYSAAKLDSDEAKALLNSSGSATIRVYNHLTARLNSSGNLRYYGNPNVNISENSSGNVIKFD